jgi:hypothetical protein
VEAQETLSKSALVKVWSSSWPGDVIHRTQ